MLYKIKNHATVIARQLYFLPNKSQRIIERIERDIFYQKMILISSKDTAAVAASDTNETLITFVPHH